MSYFTYKLGCAFLEVTGDGYCDDATNIPICEFDKGDCCLPIVKTDYCVECQCLGRSFTFQFLVSIVVISLDITIITEDIL